MLGYLRQELASQAIENIEIIQGEWPAAAPGIQVDYAYSAHVVYPIEDIASFVRAMDAAARRLCSLHLMAWQPWFDRPLGPAGPDLFEAVHGEPRVAQPTYLEALEVLRQLGCPARVEVSLIENRRVFESLEDAVDQLAEPLAAAGDPARLARLRAALDACLDRFGDGRVGGFEPRYPLATISWEPGALH